MKKEAASYPLNDLPNSFGRNGRILARPTATDTDEDGIMYWFGLISFAKAEHARHRLLEEGLTEASLIILVGSIKISPAVFDADSHGSLILKNQSVDRMNIRTSDHLSSRK